MNAADMTALLPLIIIAATSIVIMLVIAFYRDHRLTALLTLAGLFLAAASLPFISAIAPRSITQLLIIDHYA
ncbi:MAG TPA: NADH-quinone oxidoreductase subunit N, partial [Nitrospirota bacterium]|nr:NADH-quinone oxidoreductase subunit N [Nitrospirota bacterium]